MGKDNYKNQRQRRRSIHQRGVWLKRIRRGLIIAAAAAFGMIGILIWQDWHDTKIMKELRDELKETLGHDTIVTSSELSLDENRKELSAQDFKMDESDDMSPEQRQEWFRAIWEQNHDFAAWITIPNTKVDYPLLQRVEDEDYYLTRGFDGKNNKNGSLFADSDAVIGSGRYGEYEILPSDNLIIHGHSRKSGEMFGELLNYADENYARAHSLIYLDTEYERREYEVIAVLQSEVYMQSEIDKFKYYDTFKFENELDFMYFYNNIKEMSFFDMGTEATFGDTFITLSTCSYLVDNTRFVVIGKRVMESHR